MFPLLVGIAIIWLVLTAIGQSSIGLLTRMRRWDPLGLLPCWYFFAPNPVRYDTVLLWRRVASGRDLSDSGVAGQEWMVAAIPYAERAYHIFFNPSRRIQKSVHDLQTAIGNLSDQFPIEKVCGSSPVRALRGYVLGELEGGRGRESGQVQFAIARVTNTRTQPEGRIVFVSDSM